MNSYKVVNLVFRSGEGGVERISEQDREVGERYDTVWVSFERRE